MSIHRVMIYTRFERFLHWTQALAILTLLFTGLAVRGTHHLVGFETTALIHTTTAMGLMILWLFWFFWLFTTGNWRHFMPTRQGLWRIVRFYAYGIFRGERHPYRRAFWRKHNPLQAAAYLGLEFGIFPTIWISGLLYLYLAMGGTLPGVVNFPPAVAIVHVLAAYAMILFVMIHVYMLTIGEGFLIHVRPMIDGFGEVDLTPEEEAYLEADEPHHIKDGRGG